MPFWRGDPHAGIGIRRGRLYRSAGRRSALVCQVRWSTPPLADHAGHSCRPPAHTAQHSGILAWLRYFDSALCPDLDNVASTEALLSHKSQQPATMRRSRRQTNLRPDQVSSTAHTLVSTRPRASATSLTTFSVRLVSTRQVPLRPDDPQPSIGKDHLLEYAQASLELRSLSEEGHHDVSVAPCVVLHNDTCRELRDHTGRSIQQSKRRPLLDTELRRKRCFAISGHARNSMA